MRHDPNLRTEAFPLETVQRWMQAVVVHPGNTDEALASPEASREIRPENLADLILPSATLTAQERVGIYHDMYLLRMVEALSADYPSIRHFLGEEPFVKLVARYIQLFPSRSYTLNRLGDHFPEFLAEKEGSEFLHDLARLELAVTHSFDSEISPELTAEALQSVPSESWVKARLIASSSLRVLEFRFDVNAAFESAKRGAPAILPRRRASWLAVCRKDYSVWRQPLTRAQYGLLTDLIAGTPLGEAAASASPRLKKTRAADEVFAWFRAWVAQGFFSEVQL